MLPTIRDAVADAHGQRVGSAAWLAAVGRARSENSEHLAEEEDEALPDFRRHAGYDVRAKRAADWLRCYHEHPHGQGIDPGDRVPVQYLRDHR
jgi:hypothetical protein